MTKPQKKVGQKKRTEEMDEQKDSAARDQREKKYYYDDWHGYEIYQPEQDEEKDEN